MNDWDKAAQAVYSADPFTEADMVNSPAHYTQQSIECIDYIKQQTGVGFKAYCLGNATKYLHRHAYKGNPVQDLEKAVWYINRLIEEYTEWK